MAVLCLTISGGAFQIEGNALYSNFNITFDFHSAFATLFFAPTHIIAPTKKDAPEVRQVLIEASEGAKNYEL